MVELVWALGLDLKWPYYPYIDQHCYRKWGEGTTTTIFRNQRFFRFYFEEIQRFFFQKPINVLFSVWTLEDGRLSKLKSLLSAFNSCKQRSIITTTQSNYPCTEDTRKCQIFTLQRRLIQKSPQDTTATKSFEAWMRWQRIRHEWNHLHSAELSMSDISKPMSPNLTWKTEIDDCQFIEKRSRRKGKPNFLGLKHILRP